jgi:hypothetical protein
MPSSPYVVAVCGRWPLLERLAMRGGRGSHGLGEDSRGGEIRAGRITACSHFIAIKV